MTEYAWIENKNTAQTVKWLPWSYLLDLLDILEKEPELIILKARQDGVSWLLAGYSIWKALFNESARILLLSQGEEEAWDLVSKTRFIWSHLPDFLRIELNHDTRSLIDFKANNSEVKALPSTDKAGRSTDATVVIRDELAQHPYGKENFSAIGPTIDSGGQAVDVSTINKLDLNNHFTERVNKAKSGAKRTDYPSGLTLFTGGESGSTLIFLGWKLRPVRQEGLTLEDWFETRIKPKYEAFEIEQEYPETIEEALSAPKIVCRFDINALNEMLIDCHRPIREEYNGLVKIYKESVAGRKYCFPIDPSEGDYDPSIGIIVDWQTSEEVAKYSGKIPIDDQARIAWDLYQRYNNPYCAPERNTSGILLIDKLKNMGVTNWHHTSKDKEGWWTSSQTRPIMLAELAEAIRLRGIRIVDANEIDEFRSFIGTEKHPDGIARRGCHDDAVMAWAILVQIRKVAHEHKQGQFLSVKRRVTSYA